MPANRGFKRFGDCAEMALDGFSFGHRSRIGLVLSRPVAVQRQLVEQICGRRSGMVFGFGIVVGEGEGAVVACHGGCLLPEIRPRPSRPSRRSPGRGRSAAHPRAAASGGWRGQAFVSRCKAGALPRRRKMRGGRHCAGDQGGPVSGRPAAPADRRSGRPGAALCFRLKGCPPPDEQASSFRRDPGRQDRYAGPH